MLTAAKFTAFCVLTLTHPNPISRKLGDLRYDFLFLSIQRLNASFERVLVRIHDAFTLSPRCALSFAVVLAFPKRGSEVF